MTSGWYVVNGEVTVAERMTATGEVHLILADGAHLTASLGITVNEGNSLYIYGQSSDESTMGKLTATTTSGYDAAIGSLKANYAGNIVINGGNINASASASGGGAAIGSARSRGGYQITINAGMVTATSGNSSAAIGSGNNGGDGAVWGTVHSICINGGVVNATVTANGGAAIGGGSSFDGGDITITGGTVTATNKGGGAAIGGGMYGSGGNITITGGNVSATYTHSFRYGAAIGAGYYGKSAGNILITGGTVTATSNRGCGIGAYNGDNGRIVILGGTVNASGSGTVHIKAGASGSMMLVDGTTVTISGDFTLQTDFVLPEGYTLKISEGATLTIPEGVTLTLPEEYTLVSNGTVNAVGTVNCITHKYVEGVCICGLECSHVGGTPTCTAPAVCTTCGTGYGEVDPTNHNWENGVCTYGCNTNHEPHDWSGKDGICTVCGATCTHTGGTATCKTQAVCEVCEVSYGELDPDNHEYENNNGFCTECDAYEPATLVTNENYESFYLKADYVGYYAISNAGQLFWYANYINTVDRTANAVLVADIDLENRLWTPIGATGENSNNFRGIFDGQNYYIRGLYVEGDRAGLGFFGEVRTGTVKNFTIFGEVVVNTEVDYVGGVIGSVCGVNGENDLERNGAIIQNIRSFVNLTAKAHGVGKIGGFVGYANHESLIEKCSWYGTFDAGEYRVDNGAGGFIGRIQENSSEVTIRNCGAYGTIKTNYAGDYNDTATIYMGGFLSFSNTNAQTTIENCLFAGRFERGENLTDQAFLGAFGTLRNVKAIKNCYYLGDDGLEAVHSDSNLKPGSDNVEITKVTGEDLRGEMFVVWPMLGEYWEQGVHYPTLKDHGTHWGSETYSYTDNGDGTHDMVCTGCGYVVVYNEAHTPADNATYTDNNDGTHSSTCAVCGNITEEHAFDENGTCVCGVNLFSVSGSTLTIDGTLGGKIEATEEDITFLVNKIQDCVDNGITTIIVTGSEPALYNFYGIDTSAVSAALYYLADGRSDSPYCGTIDLILPDVTEIVDDEFNNTFALNSITLPKVTTVGDGAFYATTFLQTLTFGSVITFVNEKNSGPFHMDGYEVGGCDLVLNCGQLQAEDKYKPNFETNVWFIGDWSGEYEWKSITLTHNGGEATCVAKAVCETCGEEYGDIDANAHNYGEGVLTRPIRITTTDWDDGYYTYTCSACGHYYHETVKRADYTALDAILEDFIDAMNDKTLLDSIRNELEVIYFDNIKVLYGDYIESEQAEVDALVETMTQKLAEVEAGVADGTLVKADYTEIDEAIAEIEQKLDDENITDEGKAGLEEIKAQLEEMKADENTSAADVAELEKALENYEEELDKGIEDGTLVEVHGFTILIEYNNEIAQSLIEKYGEENYNDLMNSITDAVKAEAMAIEEEAVALTGTVAENAEKIAELKERLKALFDAAELCLAGTHSFINYTETSSAKCEVNAKETGTCWFCGETDEREVEGTALSHSFTKYEETEAPKCGVAGKEVAYCDNGCQTTDERETPALEHIFLDYVSNGDATCTADGTKTASCIHGCGATDTVADEGSMIDHTDEDGDFLCDHGCGYEFEKPAEPDTPDEPTDDTCDHICHSNNALIKVLWKIINFFYRLFNIQQYCDCGVIHYDTPVFG